MTTGGYELRYARNAGRKIFAARRRIRRNRFVENFLKIWKNRCAEKPTIQSNDQRFMVLLLISTAERKEVAELRRLRFSSFDSATNRIKLQQFLYRLNEAAFKELKNSARNITLEKE